MLISIHYQLITHCLAIANRHRSSAPVRKGVQSGFELRMPDSIFPLNAARPFEDCFPFDFAMRFIFLLENRRQL